MSIKIIKPGICSTVQDMGRTGYRSSGIGTSGAMDMFAATVANYLVGNNEQQAVIEMHFPAAEILFLDDTLISITGGNFDACCNGQPVEMYQPYVAKKDTLLSFKKNISRARAYIAFGGGLEIEKWLNSYSTHLKIHAGGYKGRVFQKEDIIPIKGSAVSLINKKISVSPAVIDWVYKEQHTIRCITGPEYDLIDEKEFENNYFLISNQSDRMAYRLSGEAMLPSDTAALVSSPVTYGTVQLLPNGQLIILMADHQTTGGYPRVASVIAADLPKLAQLPVNSKIHFVFVTLLQAEEMLFSMHKQLAGIKNGCQHFYDKYRS